MRKDPNLLKSDTMKQMKKFLKSMKEDLRRTYKYVFMSVYMYINVCIYIEYLFNFPRSKESKERLHAITKSCDDFLIEVVSSLCFGQQTRPEDELIKMLLNLIFTMTEEESGSRMASKELTLYRQKHNRNPVTWSFLLQLLLENE